MMPGKRSLKFHQFEVLPIELAGDAGIPVIRDQRQLLGEIDFVHCGLLGKSDRIHKIYRINEAVNFLMPIL
jgi:hypothetical protein